MNNKIITFWASDREIKILQIIKQTEQKSISEGGPSRRILARFTDEIERGENDQGK